MTHPLRRILIADDHDVIRRGVRALIETRSDYLLVAETTNGRDAIEAARNTDPHIAIIDYSMPGTHRASAIQKLRLRTTADLGRYAVRNNIIAV
jgi:DNA-binding NarL/FixJ family response regulator